MTLEECEKTIAQALRCPFCGKELIVRCHKYDTRYVGHPSLNENCLSHCPARMAQILTSEDLELWNTRHIYRPIHEENR